MILFVLCGCKLVQVPGSGTAPVDSEADGTEERACDSGDSGAPRARYWTLEEGADRTWLVSPEGAPVFWLGVNSVMRTSRCDGMQAFIQRMEPQRAAARSWARLSTGQVNGEEVARPYCFNSVGAFSETNDFDDSPGDSYMVRPPEDGGAGAPYAVLLNPAARGDAWSLKDAGGQVLRPGHSGYRVGDPYNPAFHADLDRMVAEDVATRRDDPALQMWFLGNEIGLFDRADPAGEGVLDLRRALWSDCPDGSTFQAPLCAPDALGAHLERTHGSIGALNAAWGTSHVSFAALLQSRPAPREPGCGSVCQEDLQAFVTEELLPAWVREATSRVRAADPNHLLASPRLALAQSSKYRFWDGDVWSDAPEVPVPVRIHPFGAMARAGSSGFDLIAVNVYTGDEGFEEPWFSAGLSRMHELTGLPVLVSEFGVRGRIEGWSNSGGATAWVPSDEVDDQVQRGERYVSQLAQIAQHRFVVGAAWHAWSDRYVADDPDHQINLGLVQCDDPERGLQAGRRWNELDERIASANCDIGALLAAGGP